MADNIHPVVELLAARMESHPEEFKFHNGSSLAITGRWETWINQLGWYLSEDEKELIYGKAKELIFQRVHEEVLDELLNGEERRAEERRQREEEEKRYVQQQQAQLQQLQQQQQQVTASRARQEAARLYGQTQGITLGSNQYANSIAPANLRLGSETIDEGMIKQIKRKLGL